MAVGKNKPRRKRAPYAKRACIHCKNAKAKCDNNRPCRRCIKMGLAHECVDAVRKTSKKKKKKKVTNKNESDTYYPNVSNYFPVISNENQGTTFNVDPSGFSGFSNLRGPMFNKTFYNNPHFVNQANSNSGQQNYSSNNIQSIKGKEKTDDDEKKKIQPYIQPINFVGMDKNFRSYNPNFLTNVSFDKQRNNYHNQTNFGFNGIPERITNIEKPAISYVPKNNERQVQLRNDNSNLQLRNDNSFFFLNPPQDNPPKAITAPNNNSISFAGNEEGNKNINYFRMDPTSELDDTTLDDIDYFFLDDHETDKKNNVDYYSNDFDLLDENNNFDDNLNLSSDDLNDTVDLPELDYIPPSENDLFSMDNINEETTDNQYNGNYDFSNINSKEQLEKSLEQALANLKKKNERK